MNILGVSAFGDSSGAALVQDGVPVAAAEEERFTRRRADAALPRRAVAACLRRAGLTTADLDALVFYEKPLRKFERVLAQELAGFPRSWNTFGHQLFLWLGDHLWLKNELASEFGVPRDRILFSEHQRSHAASAFFPSPFDEAAVLTVDGVGEWSTASLGHGRGTELEILAEVDFPSSLGLLASAAARFLGLSSPNDSAELAALAAYGEPRFADALERYAHVGGDRCFVLERDALVFDRQGDALFGPGLVRALGGARPEDVPIRYGKDDHTDADVAASVQAVLEQAVVACARELRRRVPSKNLCLAGQIASNVAANAALVESGTFERLFVQPACTDAGAALGAALSAYHELEKGERRFVQEHCFLGEDIVVDSSRATQRIIQDEARVDAIVRHLAEGRMVGWVRGRSEWGGRTLGHRTLLADPRDPAMRERVAREVKGRDGYLPFSPALPAERADEYFHVPAGARHAARFREIALKAREGARQSAPAALHVDGRACAQLVDADQDPLFHRLLTRFGEATGAPLVLATSLHRRGEPPVRSGRDAETLFQRSGLDVLVVEDAVYVRDGQEAAHAYRPSR